MISFNLQKFTIFLLLISVCFIGNSCKKVLNDPAAKEEVNNHLNATHYAGEPNAKKITFQQFLAETKGMNANVIQKFSPKSVNSKQIVFSESANLVLVVDSLKKMNLNGHTTYTFPVIHDDADSTTFKNVMIDLYENKTEVFLISYTPSQQFLYNFSQKIQGGFSGTVRADIIDPSTSALQIQKLKDNLQQVCSTAMVYTGTTEVLCPCTGHHVADQCTCDTKPYFYDNYATLTTCWTVEIPSGGGGGNGGTGGGGGTTPTVPPNYNPCPPVANPASIDGKKINLLPGGGGGGCPVVSPPTNTQPSVQDIIINLTNPCLSAIVNKLKNDNTIQSSVTNTLRNTFGVTNQVNISFSQADLTQTNIGQASANTSGSQLNNLDVVFNTPIIANASKEYLTEVAMHEIYHAFLYVNPTVRGSLSQHLYMAQNYVNTEVASLRVMYPVLSQHDALCLVVAGYGDLQSGNPSAFNAVLAAYNLNLNDVVNTNNSYKNGTKGTHC